MNIFESIIAHGQKLEEDKKSLICGTSQDTLKWIICRSSKDFELPEFNEFHKSHELKLLKYSQDNNYFIYISYAILSDGTSPVTHNSIVEHIPQEYKKYLTGMVAGSSSVHNDKIDLYDIENVGSGYSEENFMQLREAITKYFLKNSLGIEAESPSDAVLFNIAKEVRYRSSQSITHAIFNLVEVALGAEDEEKYASDRLNYLSDVADQGIYTFKFSNIPEIVAYIEKDQDRKYIVIHT